MSGKVVWITGASGGIGEALAYELARRGCQLVLSALRAPELERVRQQCQSPDAHMLLPLDVAATDSLTSATASVLDRFGHIDVLVNNAGVSQRSHASETSLEVDRRIMEVNYFGSVALTKAVLPSMLERGSGHIVVISSLAGKLHTPLRSAYTASKHALQGFFSCLRDEVHPQGLRVSIICPGFVRTNISINALRGDGSRHEQMDEGQQKAMSAERFAVYCAKAIEREQSEALIGGPEIWVARMAPLLPRLYDTMIRRVKST